MALLADLFILFTNCNYYPGEKIFLLESNRLLFKNENPFQLYLATKCPILYISFHISKYFLLIIATNISLFFLKFKVKYRKYC